jgi:hypothetical protein
MLRSLWFTVSRPLFWNKAPIWVLRPDPYYCQRVAGLLMWGALSDERTGLSFTIAAGPRQRSHSRVRVPWESRPYFTVSDSRLHFSSPPTTRTATVEVLDPASTRDIELKLKQCYDRRSDGKSVFASSTHLGLKARVLFLSGSCGFVDARCSLRRQGGSDFYNVQYIYILYVITWMYIQYIQGLCQFTDPLSSNRYIHHYMYEGV